jgi:hypothetical protein
MNFSVNKLMARQSSQRRFSEIEYSLKDNIIPRKNSEKILSKKNSQKKFLLSRKNSQKSQKSWKNSQISKFVV